MSKISLSKSLPILVESSGIFEISGSYKVGPGIE